MEFQVRAGDVVDGGVEEGGEYARKRDRSELDFKMKIKIYKQRRGGFAGWDKEGSVRGGVSGSCR